jgi:hypothetical protein
MNTTTTRTRTCRARTSRISESSAIERSPRSSDNSGPLLRNNPEAIMVASDERRRVARRSALHPLPIVKNNEFTMAGNSPATTKRYADGPHKITMSINARTMARPANRGGGRRPAATPPRRPPPGRLSPSSTGHRALLRSSGRSIKQKPGAVFRAGRKSPVSISRIESLADSCKCPPSRNSRCAATHGAGL